MGYLEWWDHSRDSRKQNSKKASTAAIVETKIENDSSEKSSTLATVAGNGSKVLNISTLVSNSAWIIDSGAMDHMTFGSSLLDKFHLLNLPHKILFPRPMVPQFRLLGKDPCPSLTP